jgi:hypothetical protein
MNFMFAHLLGKCVLIFMDDILLYTPTLEQHQELLTQVFKVLQDHQLFVKHSKYSFAQSWNTWAISLVLKVWQLI